MADGAPLPDWKFRTLDYIALGFILLATEELWRRPQTWYSWSSAFAVGVICAWFGDVAPTIKMKLLGWWRAPKDLAAALAENASLKQENSELRRSLATPREAVRLPDSSGLYIRATTAVRPSLPAPPVESAIVKPRHNVQCVGFKAISDDPFTIAALIFRNVPNGKLLGKFTAPSLRVIYYDNSTGLEIADMCPTQWWNSEGENGPREIDANEHYADVASFFEGKGEWRAYELNEPLGDELYSQIELNSVELPAGEYRIIAMLSGEYRNLSIPQVTGVLTLGEDGTASFQRTSD